MHRHSLQDYAELLKRLHQNKLIHTLDEFVELSKEISSYFDAAITRCAIEPYQSLAKRLQEGLTNTSQAFQNDYARLKREHPLAVAANRGKIGFILDLDNFQFMYLIPLSGVDKAQETFQTVAEGLEQRTRNFAYAREGISSHIQIEVLPNDVLDGERTLLGQGYFVFPTTIRSEGFFVFKYLENTCPCCKNTRAIVFEPTSEYSSLSQEEAMVKYVPSNAIGSVVIARNTEKYPLSETVMPILAEKYALAVNERDYN